MESTREDEFAARTFKRAAQSATAIGVQPSVDAQRHAAMASEIANDAKKNDHCRKARASHCKAARTSSSQPGHAQLGFS